MGKHLDIMTHFENKPLLPNQSKVRHEIILRVLADFSTNRTAHFVVVRGQAVELVMENFKTMPI